MESRMAEEHRTLQEKFFQYTKLKECRKMSRKSERARRHREQSYH